MASKKRRKTQFAPRKATRRKGKEEVPPSPGGWPPRFVIPENVRATFHASGGEQLSRRYYYYPDLPAHAERRKT